mmetsp:Transcript_20497/g.48097  ORF Transcript_20497/g.48097 Transcript_20497/m.48097 type:complete len:91 (-) Transcript_20497:2948-3220(-)
MASAPPTLNLHSAPKCVPVALSGLKTSIYSLDCNCCDESILLRLYVGANNIGVFFPRKVSSNDLLSCHDVRKGENEIGVAYETSPRALDQ